MPKGDVLLAALSLVSLASPLAAGGRAEPVVKIDPRMLVELATVRGVVASKDNPVWPTWNAADTPVLIYLPGVQDVLIDHPKPPEGFVRLSPLSALPGSDVRVKDGETLIGWDGQNTSREIGGVSTLVLCDTPSTLKQKLRGILGDPRPAETKLAELDYERDLVPDVYGELATIVHEGFHVFQTRSAPEKGADERDVRLYPCLSVDNNVGFALEGVALAECMRAKDPAEARAAAVRWLVVRDRRRAALPAQAIRYEDGNEYMEGLAMYAELALMRALQGRAPDPRLYAYQGFHGFADLSFYRERRLGELLGNTNGTVNVNNDPYGTSPVRHRLYFTGMAIASLLDRFLPGWEPRIFARDVSLTDLARQALHPAEAERKAALAQADRSASLDSLRRAKVLLAQEGRRNTDSLLASVLEAPAGTVVIDYSALDTRKIGLSFTGYGVRALDTLRTIYTLVPIGARVGSTKYGFEQSQPLPTLEDRGARSFAFPLARALTKAEEGELTRHKGGPGDSLDVRVPGGRLFARRAAVETSGRTIRIRYLPPPDSAP